jgi:hypothetical protein
MNGITTEQGSIMGILHPRDVERLLPHLSKSYAEASGSPFRHFYCPILQTDEECELCMGHIVNESIPNSCRKRVVQRKDVDGFYGRVVEADFATLIQADEKGWLEAVFDPALSKKIKPKVILNDEECEHHTHVGHRTAPSHSLVDLDAGEGMKRQLVLHMPPEAVVESLCQHWQLRVEGDYFIPAIASLIKAAYLTLFRLLGYRYALSPAGRHVGNDILGQFFRDNRDKALPEAKAAAQRYFRDYAGIVRPINAYSGTPPLGTIEDRQMKASFCPRSREAFALVVCVRTNTKLNAVLMPAFTKDDSVAAYFEFLKNERETIWLEHCQYDVEKDQWSGDGNQIEMRWPKDNDSVELL